MKAFDVFGNEIQVGDTVVYASRRNSNYLRKSIVRKIMPKGQISTDSGNIIYPYADCIRISHEEATKMTEGRRKHDAFQAEFRANKPPKGDKNITI